MTFTVLTHVQQQIWSMINALTESVNEKIIRIYLKSLSTDALLDSLLSKINTNIISCERLYSFSDEEIIWKTFTFLNNDNFIDSTDVINNIFWDVINSDSVSSSVLNYIMKDLFNVFLRSEYASTSEFCSSVINFINLFLISFSFSADSEFWIFYNACVCERYTK